MSNVVQFREYVAKPIIEQIEILLQMAKEGRVQGFAFSVKEGPLLHGIGLCGDYRTNPSEVLIVTARIKHRVNQLIDKQG